MNVNFHPRGRQSAINLLRCAAPDTMSAMWRQRNRSDDQVNFVLRLCGCGLGMSLGLLVLLWSVFDQTGSASLNVLAQSAANNKEEILYIDGNGQVRVYDYSPPNVGRTTREVLWFSPEADGDWDVFDVLDVTGDGDFEIVASRRGPSDTSTIVIYDPVLGAGDSALFAPTQVINEIPWARLYMSPIAGTVDVVAAGNLDLAIPGDEILYSVEAEEEEGVTASDLASHKRSNLYLMRKDQAMLDGAHWLSPTVILNEGAQWTQIRVDNIDNEGAEEEILLLSEEFDATLQIYRFDGSMVKLFENISRSRPWRSADIGQWDSGGAAEIAAVRYAPAGFATFWVFRYAPDQEGFIKDRYSEVFAPNPEHLFFADVNGSGDGEIFMLRGSVDPAPAPTPTPVPRPHLIMRARGVDAVNPIELVLDADSGYKTGAGGDVDGDLRDEIVIARNDNIRIYNEPATNIAAVTNSPLSNDARNLKIANLDSNGFLQLPRFAPSPVEPQAVSLPAGTRLRTPLSILLGTDQPSEQLSFQLSIEGNPGWVSVTPPAGQTPSNVLLSIDAYGLEPVKTYRAYLVVDDVDKRAANSPLRIPITLEVTPGLWPQPATLGATVDCEQPQPITLMLAMGGLLRVQYTAQIVDGPAPASEPETNQQGIVAEASLPPEIPDEITGMDAEPVDISWPSAVSWATLSGATRLLPTTLIITLDPSQRAPAEDLSQAHVRVDAQDNLGNPRSIAVPLTMGCITMQVYFPRVFGPP
jgi:hypothetical protein